MRRPGNLRFRGKLEIAQTSLEPRRTRSRLPWNRAPATLEQGPGYLGTGPRLPWNRAHGDSCPEAGYLRARPATSRQVPPRAPPDSCPEAGYLPPPRLPPRRSRLPRNKGGGPLLSELSPQTPLGESGQIPNSCLAWYLPEINKIRK